MTKKQGITQISDCNQFGKIKSNALHEQKKNADIAQKLESTISNACYCLRKFIIIDIDELNLKLKLTVKNRGID